MRVRVRVALTSLKMEGENRIDAVKVVLFLISIT